MNYRHIALCCGLFLALTGCSNKEVSAPGNAESPQPNACDAPAKVSFCGASFKPDATSVLCDEEAPKTVTLKEFKCHSALKYLGLPLADLKPVAAKHLGTLKQLKELVIGRIDDAGADELKVLQNLESLTLRGGKGFTDKGLESIAQIKSLKSLSIHTGVSLTKEGLQQITNLTQLQELKLSSLTALDDSALTPFTKLQELAELTINNCYSCTFSAQAPAVFEGLSNLRRLTLKKAGFAPAGLDALQKARPDLEVLVTQ